MEPNATIATTKTQPKELEEFEGGEQLPFIGISEGDLAIFYC